MTRGGSPAALTVVARAPVRVDLAGGTLDLWPLGLLHPGACTLAVAVSLRVEARAGVSTRPDRHEIEARDLGERLSVPLGSGGAAPGSLELLARVADTGSDGRGLSLSTHSPVRAGSGLGTSSALGVAALAAVDRVVGRRRSRSALVAAVRDIEAAILGIPAGVQDHWAAVHGGAVRLDHVAGGPRVSPLEFDAAALGERLLVVDSGEGRSSAPSNWDMFRRRVDGDPGATDAFRRIAAAGREACDALVTGDWAALGRAMRTDTEARIALSPLVMTGALDAIVAAARAAGAAGERVCGAGGGGFAILLAPDLASRGRIADAVRAAGGTPVSARPAVRGLTVRARQSSDSAMGIETS